jgi:hypothetical protein
VGLPKMIFFSGMPQSNVQPYGQVFPPKAGVVLHIVFTHLEAQAVRNAPGLAEIAAIMAGVALGPLAGSLVYGYVFAARQEIGDKDVGNGVDFAIDARSVPPPPSVSTSVASR